MKILILNFSHSEKLGGQENHLINLVNGLKHKGQDIQLISSNQALIKYFKRQNWPVQKMGFSNQPVDLKKSFVFLLASPFLFLKILFILIKYRFFQKYQILFCCFLGEKILATLPAKILGYKIFWEEHTNVKHWLFGSPYRLFYKLFSKFTSIIAGSQFIKKQLVEKLNITEKRIKVVYPGTLTDKNVGSQENIFGLWSKKNYHPDNKKQFVLGTVSYLNKEKGLEYLFQAIKIAKNFSDNIQLIIIGEGPDRANLIWLSKQLNIDKNIRLIGFKEEPLKWLNNFDIYVAPSVEKESFGFTIIKAMACQKPVIAPKVDHMMEIVEQKQSGILIEPHNPEMLAQVIINFYNHPEWLEQMGKNARRRVEQKFSLDKMINKYFEIFNPKQNAGAAD